MTKFCLKQWNKNKDKLEQVLRTTRLKDGMWSYKLLVKLIVENILNEEGAFYEWDSENIHEINDGEYQGTLLYLIPESSHQPSEWEYLMTFIGYGSCSVCDTLESILSMDYSVYEGVYLTEAQVREMMILCKDIVTNIIKPYNCGWREKEEFKEVEYEKED